MGRKPKPTYLKIMDGNPGKRPFNDREPKPLIRAPEPPNHLDALAVEEWNRLAPLLVELGALSELDRGNLALLCQAYSRWVQAETGLVEDGYVLYGKGESGGAYQNPLLAVANKAMEQIHKLSAEFGLTPSSRSKIQALPSVAGGKTSLLSAFAQSKIS